MSDTPWYTKREYCRVFRVSDSTVDRHVKSGRILRRVEGSRSFFRPADEATPDDPQEATLRAIERLATAIEEQSRLIASLDAKLDATRGVTHEPPQIAATHEAPPVASDVAPPKAPWWRRLLYGPEGTT